MTTAVTTVLLVFLGAFSRLLPHPPNAVALGALALFAGARLPRGLAILVPLAAMAASDVVLDFGTGRRALSATRLTIYATFAVIALAGRWARAASPGRLAVFSVGASSLFFVTSNFVEWAASGLYPHTAAGLVLCYVAALPFFGHTLLADLAGTAVLFSLDALSRRLVARRGLTAAATLLVVLVPMSARGQAVPPQSESVVVTATLSPEEERDLGSATTVITRRQIENRGQTTVLEVLRSVPGVDVVRQGSDGSLTSLFLRGTNSTHALVLVDGARVNSPYFPGYDFSALSTENVERIEVVRGPFSALYGSDAIGGVIQIFTRPAAAKPAGRVSLESGDAGQRQGSVFFSTGAGPFSAAASYRDAWVGGDRRNSDWHGRNGSLRLETRIGDNFRAALEGTVADGDLGLPGAVGAETPHDRYGFREERFSLPISFRPGPRNEASFLAAYVISKPTSVSPAYGFESRTDARTLQVRGSDRSRVGPHELTGVVSFERWTVQDRGTFGTNLDDASSVWGAAFQDELSLGGGWNVTAGLRYDHHSDFGEAWSPRANVAWLSGNGLWKLRASGGGAFRAPTVGELFYPFFGNPDLKPERSTSWEVGAERYFGRASRVEVSLFWNELTNLIVIDFVRSRNENVGKARTRGVEVAWRQEISEHLEVDAGYTWLEAKDRVADTDLLRRPRHRAFVAATVRPVSRLALSPRLVFVSRRHDLDGVTFAPTELPSYVRLDLFARYDLGHLAPYARLENATDRAYDEVDGYPAPRRRWAAGLEVKF
ncbi:MAG: TonB-dependent receptor, partial [Acidobacteriota bacterium]